MIITNYTTNTIIITNNLTNYFNNVIIQGINTNDNFVLFSAITNYIKQNSDFGLNALSQILSVIIGLGGLLFALISTILGNKESKKQFIMGIEETKKQFMQEINENKKQFIRDCYMNFKSVLNEFLLGLNGIATNILEIDTLSSTLLGTNYSNFDILSSINDYNMIALKTRTLVAYLQNNYNMNSNIYSSKQVYYDQIIESSKIILHPNIFIDLGKIMNKDIVNYIGIVNNNIQSHYDSLLITLKNASKNQMIGFDFNKYYNDVINLINETQDAVNNLIEPFNQNAIKIQNVKNILKGIL